MLIMMKLSLLTFQVILSYVNGFPQGPPPTICMAPYPHHSTKGTAHFSQPRETSPYTILLSSNSYTDNMLINITITSSITTSFKGILLTFKPNSSEIAIPVGQFLSCNALGFKFLDVQGNIKSCLVHSNGEIKPNTVQCTYQAPSANFGSLRMSAVIVTNFTMFWTRLEQVLPYYGSTVLQGIRNPTQILSDAVNNTGCETTKSCVFFPNLCILSKSCVYVVAYKKSGAYVDFELTGPDNGYLAMGLSLDEKMKDDFVIVCVNDPDANSLIVQTGFTTLLQDGSNIMYNSVDDNVIKRRTSRSQGIRYCTFSVLSTLRYQYNVTYPIDLSMELNIFLANGDLYPNTSFVRKHDEPPMILVTKTTLYTDNIKSNIYFKSLEYVSQVHGSLMTVAFLLFLPISVMIVRHFRAHFTYMVFGKQLWFYIHVSFNMLFFVFAFSGYFYMISQIDGNWEKKPEIHGSVGTVVMILSAINIVMGFARPDIGTPNRELFYWAHFINGTLIRLLSFVTFWLVFFTMTQRTAFKNWMMIVVFIWTGGEIIFAVAYGVRRKIKGNMKSKYVMDEKPVQEAMTDHVGIPELVVYFIFIFTLAVALLCGLWIH